MDGLQQALLSALSTILVALIGVITKKIVDYLNQKGISEQLHNKKEIVQIGVTAVEGLWRELKGNEKLEKAKEMILNELSQHGLSVTDKELELFIESAVHEINKNKFTLEGSIEGEEPSPGFEQLSLHFDEE